MFTPQLASHLSTTSLCPFYFFFFFFNDTATTEIYTLSLHDALPISRDFFPSPRARRKGARAWRCRPASPEARSRRSEEHTSELQSQSNLVCRLLLEKKKKKKMQYPQIKELTDNQHTYLYSDQSRVSN